MLNITIMDTSFLLKADRIRLNRDNRKRTYIALVVVYLILLICAVGFTLQYSRTIFSPLFLALAGLLFLFIVKRITYSYIATGYIKNDVVIIKLLSEKPYVLEFFCIKKIQTVSIGGLSITLMKFKFDGVKKCVILCGKPEMGESIEKIMIQYKQEKRKKSKP